VSEIPLQIATTSFEVFTSNPMAAFDQSSFAKAVQKREAKKLLSTSNSKVHSKSTTSSKDSVFRKKDNKLSELENVLSKKDKKSGKENSSTEMTMRKKLFGKLFKILTLKESSTKKCSKENKKLCHTRKRSRSSQSSTPSNFEPMPTIYEEDDEECDVISLQSFCIHQKSYNYSVAVA
jgi:hypothetical protein